MNTLILEQVVASVRRRVEQGDCPTEPAQSVETLEHAVSDLATNTAIPPLRVDWNKVHLAEAYDLVEGVRRAAAQNPESGIDSALRDALNAIEAADCEWDGMTVA